MVLPPWVNSGFYRRELGMLRATRPDGAYEEPPRAERLDAQVRPGNFREAN